MVAHMAGVYVKVVKCGILSAMTTNEGMIFVFVPSTGSHEDGGDEIKEAAGEKKSEEQQHHYGIMLRRNPRSQLLLVFKMILMSPEIVPVEIDATDLGITRSVASQFPLIDGHITTLGKHFCCYSLPLIPSLNSKSFWGLRFTIWVLRFGEDDNLKGFVKVIEFLNITPNVVEPNG
ncbi:hypothetical protein L1987_83339 [Smallanthus sonchifolius]|uniref:Uncharacterized protein n=1 Tax=Smallanthus sonchifolius TaxID=185202 RepID=A0ACB8YC56_9ASTR|nr:hypothetical protein L1987_83339 [Smallanthus sonchifolius]